MPVPDFAGRDWDLWRYRELLPLDGDPTDGLMSGYTPLVRADNLARVLGVRELVHAQPEFRIGFQEMTLVFIAFGYWAISYTMSRESRRLEAKLGVGVR